MKACIICKLSDTDAYYTIKPLADSIDGKVLTIRDGRIKQIDNVEELYYKVARNKIVNQYRRLRLALKAKADVYIGVYEYPHGVVAYLSSLLRGKAFVLNIISNPGYKKIRKGFRLFLFKFLIKRADAVAVTGRNSKKYIVKNYKISEEKVFFLPNCIDTCDYYPLKKEKKFDLITLGRFDPEKRYELTIPIVKELCKYFPEIKVGMAGSGPMLDKIKNEITQKNLDLNIEILGFVEDANQHFNEGRVFLSTSETEGLPRAAVQSASCGVPCVCSDVGDTIETIAHEKSGFLVTPYDNVDSYVKNIKLLLENIDLYNSFSEKGIKLVQDIFSLKATISKWDEILFSLNKKN